MPENVKLTAQTKKPYYTANVAQINDLLVIYAQNQSVADALNTIKTDLLATLADPKDCPQCTHVGKVDDGASVCPLCGGMTKTDGQWFADMQLLGFKKP
jgi:hypothetical protein